ncbi:MAG: exodeoxyribonuclease VII large subunit [Lactobacillales bacterium]|jgi:exodeoxyribonuclease VII large subunit|nr:exodeoxyribonuclease VII large subunit [Lactobacillales bacterium]
MSEEYLTVTALTKYLKAKFERDPYLGRVYLTGEISNFRLRPTHQYFSLKDENAVISATMFKGAFSKIKFKPEEGMKVLVVGRVSLYERSGQYQLMIEHMEPDGVGALYQALAQLREKLEKEGLFNPNFKQPLPRFPKRIAVLTSPSGAVIRDIITTTRRRYPIAQIVLFPTKVQGEGSADDIVRNIRRVEELGNFDTMIIGRGGGSIEDLWSFNEEKVVRAIFEARTPTISSVGHETDVTLADLVADVRAATPTAAAELAVPVLTDELMNIKQKQIRLENGFKKVLENKMLRFKRLKESYVFMQPERLYEGLSMRLDKTKERLNTAIERTINEQKTRYIQARGQLAEYSPKNRVFQEHQRVTYDTQRLIQGMNEYFNTKQQAFFKTVQALDLLSPLKIMGRGYSYTLKDKEMIKSVNQLKLNETVQVHYTDGFVEAEIKEIRKENGE